MLARCGFHVVCYLFFRGSICVLVGIYFGFYLASILGFTCVRCWSHVGSMLSSISDFISVLFGSYMVFIWALCGVYVGVIKVLLGYYLSFVLFLFVFY